ncbi:hypothetical protein [Bifidobacterium sp. UTBIF-78]|uniref:hypothetical protein n=1 Tax=Bifidobacterium sp. UTBIF-78 TaxID=1465263 RepID=UPI001127D361|nr:hypothetical protein [Bifidobacterium sp. UTBIF-78]TPF95490.1 hypothetical protein BG22_02210 [Bifidobacterium sp. UTBIF-78]
MLTFKNDDEFWTSSGRVQFIRDSARHERAGVWAVLQATLTRVSVVTPPNVVIPAFVGSRYGSLNYFVALVGMSSDGKGTAVSTAEKLVRDDLGAETTTPVSGEGLTTLFARRDLMPDKDDDKRDAGTTLKCVNCRALLDVAEVTSLGAAIGRSGSTLLGTLTSAWSGENLGGQNVSEAKRLRAVAYGYRLGLITGVQPGNSDILTREDVTGLPQRIAWANTRDPDAPPKGHKPPAPESTFGFDPAKLKAVQPTDMELNALYQAGSYWKDLNENGSPAYPIRVLDYPDCVADEVDEDAVNRLHGTRPAGLDGHSLFLTIKTAGLLAIMEQRPGAEFTVSEDDWARAKYIVKRSREFREQCIRSGRETMRGKRRDALADEFTARDEAREQADREKAERDFRRYEARICTVFGRYDKGHEGLKGYVVQKRTGIPAADCYATIERMHEADRIGTTEERAGSQIWAISPSQAQTPDSRH